MQERGLTYTQVAKSRQGYCENTFLLALKGKSNVAYESAVNIAKVLDVDVNQVFNVRKESVPYADKTNALVEDTVRAVLAYAVEMGLIVANFAAKMYHQRGKKTKGATLKSKRRKRPKAMYEDEIKKLCQTALEYPDIRYGTLALVLLHLGLRRGETAGLRWSAVDLDKGQVTISNNLIYIARHGCCEEAPKTERSERTLDLPETLKSQLKKYQDWYDVQRLKAGTAWAENRGHLFVNLDTGKAVNPKTLSDWLSTVTNEAGLGHWNLHSMRHTNVSYKIQRGVPLAEVSADAGHSNLTVTTTIYAHDIGKGNRQAPKIFDMMMTELGKKEQNQQEEDYQLHKAVGANIYPF